jgi:apolipoprotein D and lipocalin family protein
MNALPRRFPNLTIGGRTLPEGVEAVRDFDARRYLGKWFEVARIENRFERGLSHTSAEYSFLPGGTLKVVNRGYEDATGRWKEARGRARFVRSPDLAQLCVSFFRPFYGAYAVVDLDRDGYTFALVCGGTRDYLWILARTPSLQQEILARLNDKARALGFDPERLLYPAQG